MTDKLTYTELQALIDMVDIELHHATNHNDMRVQKDNGKSVIRFGYTGKLGELTTIKRKLEAMQMVDIS